MIRKIKIIENNLFSRLKRGINAKTFSQREISLISNDCVGGIILHNLACKFNTPTINLWFEIPDYLKYLQNLREYNNCPLVEKVPNTEKYPVGILKNDTKGDITLNFTHYRSFAEAKRKWEERVKRIDYNNLYVIMHLGKLTDGTLSTFAQLDYENKIIITYKEGIRGCDTSRHSDLIYIMKSLANYTPGTILEYYGWSGKRYLDEFDYKKFVSA